MAYYLDAKAWVIALVLNQNHLSSRTYVRYSFFFR
jgi:hypothetical protein